MKIERISGSANFSDVKVGEVFVEEDRTCVYLRIEVDDDFTKSYAHDGLAVNLDTGEVTWFNDCDEVTILPNAKVVY